MKLWKKILIGLGVVLGIVAILLLTFDVNRHKDYVERRLSAALGRSVSVGSLEMKLSLVPTIGMSNVIIKNPADGAEPLFKADRIDAVVYLPALMRGRLEIRDMRIPTARMHVGQPGKSAGGAASEDFQVNSLDIQQLFLTRNGKKYLFKDMSVKQLRAFSTDMTIGKNVVQVSGSITGLSHLLAQKDNFSFTADIKGWNAQIGVSGSIGSLKAGDGVVLQLTAKGDDLQAFLAHGEVSVHKAFAQPFNIVLTAQGTARELKLSGVSVKLNEAVLTSDAAGTFAPETQKLALAGTAAIPEAVSRNWGMRPFSCQFDIEQQARETSVKSLTLAAGRSDIAFAGRIIWKNTPAWRGVLQSHYLHASDIWTDPLGMLYPPEAAAQIAYQPSLALAHPVDLSGLKAVDADVGIRLSNVFLTDNLHVNIAGQAAVRNGALILRDLDIAALGGFARGDMTISAADTPQVAVDLTGRQIRLEQIPGLGGTFDNAPVQMQIRAQGQGETLADIIGSATGTIRASAENGTIVSPWFNALATAISGEQEQSSSPFFSTADKNVAVACAALSVDLDKGRAEADNLMALETSRVHFTAGGAVDLKAQTADIRLNASRSAPVAAQRGKETPPLKQIAIQGPFDSLQIATAAVPGKAPADAPPRTGLCRRVLPQPIDAAFPSVWQGKPKAALLPAPAAPVSPKQADFKQQFLEAVQDAAS
ncbi:MAG: AsmA family protein [Alphaproteobacteria bacterium]|nr:AsmA family protein [Alphaproteobacteria bacterium]